MHQNLADSRFSTIISGFRFGSLFLTVDGFSLIIAFLTSLATIMFGL